MTTPDATATTSATTSKPPKKARLALQGGKVTVQRKEPYRTQGVFGLRYSQLIEWVTAQPSGSVVGFTAQPNDCPCSRCILDLGLAAVPVGMVLEVYDYAVQIWEKAPPFGMLVISASLPAWLRRTVQKIDCIATRVIGGPIGQLPVTREQVLDILLSHEVMDLVPANEC